MKNNKNNKIIKMKLNSFQKRKIEEKKIKKIRENNNYVIFFLIIIFFIVIIIRLFVLQILDYKQIKKVSDMVMTTNITLKPKRGDIVDRNNKILATSIKTYYIVIGHEPNKTNDRVLKILKENTNLDVDIIEEKLLNSKQIFPVVAKNVERKDIEALFTFYDHEIGVNEMYTRYYPYKDLAANVIGFLNTDGTGNLGLEYEFENVLKGEEGYIETMSDAVGRKLAHSNEITANAKNGITLKTTLDITLQYYVQNAIDYYRELVHAKKITAIMENSKTGEILAMATSPSFDLNRPREIIDSKLLEKFNESETLEEKSEILQSMWRNSNISDVYEPGSTFKIFTGSIGLEEGKITRESKFKCDGFKNIDGSIARCWVYPKKHGIIDLTHSYMDSCNIAFIDTALMIGKEKFYEYINLFKLNQRTGIELPGEANSILLNEDRLKDLELARMGFGHSMSYTPIQVMNIINVIANNGNLKMPYLIQNTYLKNQSANSVISVLSEDTVNKVKFMLESTVDKGNAYRAKVDGYRIGGKTGTSIKIKDGKYDKDFTDASFIALAPIEDPQITLLIVVDEADKNYSTGSATAKIGQEILSKTFNYLGIEPSVGVKNETIIVKNYIGKTVEEAKKLAIEQGLEIKLIDYNKEEKIDKKIVKQYPVEGNLIKKGNEITIVVE